VSEPCGLVSTEATPSGKIRLFDVLPARKNFQFVGHRFRITWVSLYFFNMLVTMCSTAVEHVKRKDDADLIKLLTTTETDVTRHCSIDRDDSRLVSSSGLSKEDTILQFRHKRRRKINGATGEPRYIWKITIKTIAHVCVCVRVCA